MKSGEYRDIIRKITINALFKRFPGLEKKLLREVSSIVAINVHARLYGANVDGVDSPLWQNDTSIKPNVDASELLKPDPIKKEDV